MWIAVDSIVMVVIDLENPWLIGAVLIAVWVVLLVAAEAFLLNGHINEGVIRGLF